MYLVLSVLNNAGTDAFKVQYIGKEMPPTTPLYLEALVYLEAS